jgi:hypothetical protein
MANPVIQPNNNFNFPYTTPSNTALTVNSNGHAVIRGGDGSLWDSVSNLYVTPEQTNVGVGGVCTSSTGETNLPNQ